MSVDPITGEVTGLEPQASRAARRGHTPVPKYEPAGENGVHGAQVDGKNAGAPKHLPDGSWTSPTVAHFEAIDNANAVRGLDAAPWQQHLIDVNDAAWEPDLRWWPVAGAAASIAATARGAPRGAGSGFGGDRGGPVPAVEGIGWGDGGGDDGLR